MKNSNGEQPTEKYTLIGTQKQRKIQKKNTKKIAPKINRASVLLIVFYEICHNDCVYDVLCTSAQEQKKTPPKYVQLHLT